MFARRRRLIILAICLGILLIALLINVIARVAILQELKVPMGGSTITLNKGQGLIALNNKLAADGLIENPYLMRWWALTVRLPISLQAGTYQVNPGTRYRDLIAKISSGKGVTHAITVLNGENFARFYHNLITYPHLQHTMVNMTIGDIMAKLGSDYRHPEGLFYADTYSFYAGEEDFNILKLAYDKLNSVLEEEWQKRSKELVYENSYQALIMASIIEKETGLDRERPLIAGVFHNRLVQNMRLQADPTVIYGMGDRFDGNIHRRDLRTPTPYNTYIIYGLPPTPITLVDRRAISAVLHPSKKEYLFFVAKADGSRSHHFSKTWEEHKLAVERYQLKKK